MPSSIPSIPFDVLDIIVDFVASVPDSDGFEQMDKETISTLAAWRSTGRYFDAMVRPRLWQIVVLDDRDSRVHRYEELQELLHASPDIGGFVQSFAYKTNPNSMRNDPHLPNILRRFSKLKDIQLECIPGILRWADLGQDIAMEFQQLFRLPTLTMIELRGVKEVPTALITSCKNLTRLILRDVFFDCCIDQVAKLPQAHAAPVAASPPPQLKTLELWPRVASSDILAFNSLQMFTKVESLRLSVFDEDDLRTALAVMSSSQASVRQLKIGGTYLLDKIGDGDWKCQLDLEQLVKLEHIQVYCVMDTDAYSSKRLPAHLIVLLDRSMPSLTVTSLQISLKIYVLGTELMLHLTEGWDGLDDIVMAKYPKLQILRLHFISLFSSAPKEDEVMVRNHIRSVLPKIIASGAIKVQVITDAGLVWDL
ncbi:hypothetical protein CVT24_004962 [Panaeolus cyanescens]|uniref:F-box domain-containing protein n=1 Tax=Panaeolus cyanescens TaxID=181874 RepID=A0A409YB54_9AGAR|nr:hypothetical protein CVT24_004962 [Panaeolus cyanescens]